MMKSVLVLTLSFLMLVASQKASAAFIEEIGPESPYSKEERVNYPFWAQLMTSNFLKYNPMVNGKSLSPDCDLENWSQKMENIRDFEIVSSQIESYLKNCEGEIKTGRNDLFRNLFQTMMLKMSPKEHPYAKYVMLNLQDGQKLKGWLALKADNRRRPLVILRLGIFSTVTQFLPERFLFMQLFEQSPFNVLVLESNSGHEFIFRNKKIILGGYDEGRANIEVAQRLQSAEEPLSKIISDIHLVGLSFGGHGVMYASMLSDQLVTPLHKPLIKSAVAYCPLINFRDTFDYHLSQGVISYGINYWVSRRLKGIEEVIPALDIEHFIESFTPYINKNYDGPFWERNEFWPKYQNIKTPVTIFVTKKDPIVPLAVNSERIVNGYIDVKKSNLKVIKLEEGYHCSLPGSYDWKAMATILNTSILQQSDYRAEKISRKIPLRREEFVSGFSFSGKVLPKFTYEILRDEKEGRLLLNIHSLALKRPIETSVAFDDFGFGSVDFNKAKDILDRWLNQNIIASLSDSGAGALNLLLEWRR